eukprot:SAG31_NODE_1594_length_7791_cov_2.912192_6_plen_97_part_00
MNAVVPLKVLAQRDILQLTLKDHVVPASLLHEVPQLKSSWAGADDYVLCFEHQAGRRRRLGLWLRCLCLADRLGLFDLSFQLPKQLPRVGALEHGV